MDPLHSSDAISEGKLDLVPMIDCIMLLLLFFILTTRFSSEEKRLSSLLSTREGAALATVVSPPQDIHICIYPAGLERGLQPSDYEQRVSELSRQTHGLHLAWLRIGRQAPLAFDTGGLDIRGSSASAALERIHAYIRTSLERFETSAPDRSHQVPVIIDCYSGMPWSCALTTYDAVRCYEILHGAVKPQDGAPRDALEEARQVDFSPPQVRDSSLHERGDELFALVNHS